MIKEVVRNNYKQGLSSAGIYRGEYNQQRIISYLEFSIYVYVANIAKKLSIGKIWLRIILVESYVF